MLLQSAARKVLDALRSTLEDIPEVSGTVFIDRSEDEPFGNAEVPALNVKLITVSYSAFDHAHDQHDAVIDIDVVTDSRNLSIGADQADLAATAVTVLWADRYLGGRVQIMRFESLAGDAGQGTEMGAAPLRLRLKYLTPVGDHFTIVGQTGLTF